MHSILAYFPWNPKSIMVSMVTITFLAWVWMYAIVLATCKHKGASAYICIVALSVIAWDSCYQHALTNWGLDKMAVIFQTTLISITISLKFVPKGPINNIPALVQIMAWRRPGDKPLSEPVMVRLLTYICATRPQWVNGFYGMDK